MAWKRPWDLMGEQSPAAVAAEADVTTRFQESTAFAEGFEAALRILGSVTDAQVMALHLLRLRADHRIIIGAVDLHRASLNSALKSVCSPESFKRLEFADAVAQLFGHDKTAALRAQNISLMNNEAPETDAEKGA